MLTALDASSVEELFDEIPVSLRSGELNIPVGMKEMEIATLMRTRTQANRHLVCFAGAGAYEHYIPAAVWNIAARGEFYSAYTPYQAEASQGTLQVLYEYQSMMASLTGMEISNASLYDGASSLAEAVLMAVRANRRCHSRRILMPKTLSPRYRQVVRTWTEPQGIELLELPYDPVTGRTEPALLHDFNDLDFAAVVIPLTNFFGVLESVDELTDWARSKGALVIGVVNPVSLGLLKPPGAWGQTGADIVCGEGQPLGIPMSGGGPYFGLLCCRKEFVHQIPGRLVGRTVDMEGKPGFTLTLQAREQHIRRGKATSNICTNQGLMVTAATLYMALLGPVGLRRVAEQCHANTLQLLHHVSRVEGVEQVFSGPFFHEAVIRTPWRAKTVLDDLAERGILGGYDLSRHYPELGEAILVCATELRTDAEIHGYAEALQQFSG
jgi:glycine dehydrogenase subunit 1